MINMALEDCKSLDIYRIYSTIRRGFPLSRMSTNNQTSPMQFCSPVPRLWIRSAEERGERRYENGNTCNFAVI